MRSLLQSASMKQSGLYWPQLQSTTWNCISWTSKEIPEWGAWGRGVRGSSHQTMRILPHGTLEGGPGMACHLHRALYGLRQAPRAWHIRPMEVLTAMGFTPSAADASLLDDHCRWKIRQGLRPRVHTRMLMTCSSQHTAWQTLTRSRQASMRSSAGLNSVLQASMRCSKHMILARHASSWAWPWTGIA